MNFLKKYLSKSSFTILIIAFFFPFILIKCDRKEIARVDGIQLVTGTEIGKNTAIKKVRVIDPDIYAIIAFACALAGAGLAFKNSSKTPVLLMTVSILGVIALLLLHNNAILEAQKNATRILTLQLGWGYFLSISLFALMAIFNGWISYKQITDKS